MNYTKIYSDEGGETHFKDIDIELETVEYAPPAPSLNLSSFIPAKQYAIAVAPPGWYGDWHPTPCRQILFYLAGEVEVQVSDGEIRCFSAGGILLIEDIIGKGHISKVIILKTM